VGDDQLRGIRAYTTPTRCGEVELRASSSGCRRSGGAAVMASRSTSPPPWALRKRAGQEPQLGNRVNGRFARDTSRRNPSARSGRRGTSAGTRAADQDGRATRGGRCLRHVACIVGTQLVERRRLGRAAHQPPQVG
jgi:hypothetical protein